MHLNKKKSIFYLKNYFFNKYFLCGLARRPADQPLCGTVGKINPQILCRAGQPDPLFAGQVRGGPARIATPKK